MAAWSLADGVALKVRAFEDDDNVAVYNLSSGDTHVLSAIAGEVLSWLSTAQIPQAAVSARIRDVLGDDGEADIDRAVSDLLADLERLGLAARSV